jgi:hypothetical protein
MSAMLLCVDWPAWPIVKKTIWSLAIVWELSAATLTQVEAAQPPTVTSVSPNSGPAAGGTSVTINGTHLNQATAVTFGGTAAATFTVNNANSITATTPPHTAGAVNLAVTTSGGTNPANTLFTYVAPLTLAATASATTQVGQSYSQTNVASGGTTPYTYSVSAGTLPAGTTLNSTTGTVSGTPTAAGAFSYTIKVTDNGLPTPQTATQAMSGTITPATATTSTSVTSSLNPSSVSQSVTFTATVATGGGTATGIVTFKDGVATLGTGTLSGNKATFTTASLTLGIHSIMAIYGGDSNYMASTSAALKQSVAVPTDSLKLRAIQAAVTPLAAQISGQAITGAIDNAIEDGFVGNLQALTCNVNGITFNCGTELDRHPTSAELDSVKSFAAAPDRRVNRIDDGFAALAYDRNIAKAPPRLTTLQREWLGWIDVRGVSVDQSSIGNDLEGNQFNALVGITHKLTLDFLVGAFGGYEYFNYTSDALTSQLKGNGWTIGSYVGWQFTPTLRFDLAVARSSINFDGIAGTASGTFLGSRWLASGGLTGTYRWQTLAFQPSARIDALWEHENAYTDSLGTIQNDRNFSTGRASGGIKVSYPFVWSSMTKFAPYAGIYGDYYFTSDDASTAGLAAIPLLEGWSARFTSGLSLSFKGGTQLGFGGELGGIGGNTNILTFRGRASVPF